MISARFNYEGVTREAPCYRYATVAEVTANAAKLFELDPREIELLVAGKTLRKVDLEDKVRIQIRKTPGSRRSDASLSTTNEKVAVIKDIGEFMKENFKQTGRPKAVFVLRKEELPEFNSLNLRQTDHPGVDVYLLHNYKKAEIGKYFYFGEPPFVAFYLSPSQMIELPYEADRERILMNFEKCNDPKFYSSASAKKLQVKESSKQVSSKASSVKSKGEGSPKNPANIYLEKFVDEVLKYLRELKAAKGRERLLRRGSVEAQVCLA